MKAMNVKTKELNENAMKKKKCQFLLTNVK